MNEEIRSTYYVDYIKYVVSGFWLLFLYAASIFAVLFSLCTYQFQREIEDILIEPSSLMQPELFFKHKCDITQINRLPIKDLKDSSIIELPCMRLVDLELNTGSTAIDILRDQAYKREQNIKKTKDAEARKKLFTEQLQDTSLDETAKRFLRGDIETTKNKINVYKKELDTIESISASIKKVTQESRFYDTLFAKILGRKPNEDVDAEDVLHVWAIPGIFLSILLSLSMGALGSLVTITIEYLKIDFTSAKEINYSMYLFRPLLGAIMALVVYIAVKSGQFSFANEAVTELSPFLLSFIGVLSGMMSEQVYRKFVTYGSNVLEEPK